MTYNNFICLKKHISASSSLTRLTQSTKLYPVPILMFPFYHNLVNQIIPVILMFYFLKLPFEKKLKGWPQFGDLVLNIAYIYLKIFSSTFWTHTPSHFRTIGTFSFSTSSSNGSSFWPTLIATEERSERVVRTRAILPQKTIKTDFTFRSINVRLFNFIYCTY
jgi:hypothetical protein